jgi:hypothetical protein
MIVKALPFDHFVLGLTACHKVHRVSDRGFAERKFRLHPNSVDTGDLGFGDRVVERPQTDAVNIAAIIEKTASGFDGLLGAWIPHEPIYRFVSILNEPCHRAIRLDG